MNAGEQWERRARRQKLVALGATGVLASMAPILIAVAGADGVIFPEAASSRLSVELPLALRAVVGVAFIAGLIVVARYNWRISDEVRRAHLMSFWAATGLSVSLTFVAYLLFGSLIPESARLPLAFFLPVAGGLVYSVVHATKRGFVW